MPKGVLWRHEDVFFALGGGIDPTNNHRVERPEELVDRARAGTPLTYLPIAPLMHGATQWGVMGGSFKGNRVVLVPSRRGVPSGCSRQGHFSPRICPRDGERGEQDLRTAPIGLPWDAGAARHHRGACHEADRAADLDDD